MLQHHNYRSYLGLTCLVQISTRTRDYIVDALALRSHLQLLNEAFADPNIVKVNHSGKLTACNRSGASVYGTASILIG